MASFARFRFPPEKRTTKSTPVKAITPPCQERTRRQRINRSGSMRLRWSARGSSLDSNMSGYSRQVDYSRVAVTREHLPAVSKKQNCGPCVHPDRKSTRLNSSHGYISYAVFCLKKKIQSH